MKRIATIFIMIPLLAWAQDRIDDKAPSMTLSASLDNMTGWVKNDLGHWESGINSLANPKILIQKMEIFQMEYNKSRFNCFVIMSRDKIYHNHHWITTYCCKYWLFDPALKDTLEYKNSSALYVCFKTICENIIDNNVPITMVQLRNAIIEHMNEDLSAGKFCIEFRSDQKHNKIQFLAGSYNDELNYSDFDDGLGDENFGLTRAYYEVPSSVYESFFGKLR